jgi:hypothetical protein
MSHTYFAHVGWGLGPVSPTIRADQAGGYSTSWNTGEAATAMTGHA